MTSPQPEPHTVTTLTDKFEKLIISTNAAKTPESGEQLASAHQLLTAKMKRKLRGRRRHAQWRRRRKYNKTAQPSGDELYPHLEDLTIKDDDIM